MRRRLLSLSVVLSSAAAWAAPAISQQPEAVRGAAKVIQAVEKRDDSKQPVSPELAKAQDLLNRIAAFEKEWSSLTPDKAAATWLELLDETMKRDPASMPGGYPWQSLVGPLVMQALPGPVVWPELSKQLDARPIPKNKKEALAALSLRMMGHVMNGNRAAQQADAEALHELVRAAAPAEPAKGANPLGFVGAQSQMMNYQLMQAWPLIWYGSRQKDPDTIIKLWREQAAASHSGADHRDLVALVGVDRARPVIAEYVAHAASSNEDRLGMFVHYGTAETTARLVKAEVVKQIASFKRPPWSLVTSPDDLALYEVIAKKFPDDRSQERMQADQRYLSGLIGAGQVTKAVELYRATMPKATEGSRDESSLVPEAYGFYFGHGDNPAFQRSLAEFYAQLVDDDSPLALWQRYATAATDPEQRRKLIVALEGRMQRKPDVAHDSLEAILIDALFGADRVDDAVARSLALLKQVDPSKADSEQIQTANRLLGIGRALGQKEAEKAGLDFMIAAIRGGAPGVFGHAGQYGAVYVPESDDWVDLVEAGYAADVENLLEKRLQAGVQQEASSPGHYSFSPLGNGTNRSLSDLAKFYFKTGRPADVVTLLDTAPWWGVGDMAEMTGGGAPYGVRSDMLASDLPLTAARAFIELDQKATARRIVHALLAEPLSIDAPYELLLELEGAAALEFLDALIALDKFQERPLIWKAKLLLDLGRLDEAEQAARAAIAIDPSDGEQGKGSRMIVYGVLSDILKKKGGEKNLSDAAIYGEAVKAIRLAERADELRLLGLHSRAIAMYEQALDLFVDAYCIQSRLALELAQAGKIQEATAHFQKAFELMPDSFGRIESHCFGCEGIFEEELAQQVAERVFERQLKERPDKPQVHYLLGYLRESQDRPADALKHFQKAVELDPDYYNAWEHIQQLSARLNRVDDEPTLALLRLRGPSAAGEANYSGDLATFWKAIEAQQKRRQQQPKSIYPLPASAKALAERKDQQMPGEGMNPLKGLTFRGVPLNPYTDRNGIYDATSPAAVLMRSNPVLTTVGQILTTGY
jgi:tetratricopeptide (TPR) repeat protein